MVGIDELIKEQGQGEVEQPHTERGMSMDELGDESSFASEFLELFPERNESEDTQFVPVPGNPDVIPFPDPAQPVPLPLAHAQPAQPPGTKVKQVPRRTSISAPKRAISKKSQERSSSAGGGGASAPMDFKEIERSLNSMPALKLRKLNRGVGKVSKINPSHVMVEIFTKEELEPKEQVKKENMYIF